MRPSAQPNPPPRQRHRHAADQPTDRGGWVANPRTKHFFAIANLVIGVLGLVGHFVPASQQVPPTTTVIVVTPQTTAPSSCTGTVTPEGGTTATVHPPSTPEGSDHKETEVNVNQGERVTAVFTPYEVVEVIVLEVRGDRVLVHSDNRRAEWIPLSDLR